MFSIFAIVLFAIAALFILLIIFSCICDPKRALDYLEYSLALVGGTFALYYFSSYLIYVPVVAVLCFVATKVDIKSLNIAQNLNVQAYAHASWNKFLIKNF